MFSSLVKDSCEELYSVYEDKSWKYLRDLQKEDLSFFKNNTGFEEFVYYLCLQLYRTPRLNLDYEKYGLKAHFVPYFRFILSNLLLFEIWKEQKKYHLILINNHTDLEFIIGDHPILDLEETNLNLSHSIFFPISPKKAILLTKEERKYDYLKDMENNQDVHNINKMICSVCCHSIYASNKEVLKAYNYRALSASI